MRFGRWSAVMVAVSLLASFTAPVAAAPAPPPAPSSSVHATRPMPAAGPTRLPKTVTPGSTWNWQNPSPNGDPVYSINCPSASVCFAAGDHGDMQVSADAGSTWSRQATGVTTALYAVSCASTANCVAVGANGVVVRTADGGTTWSQTSTNSHNFLSGVSCPGTSVCFAVGFAGSILKTSDGGATWSSESSGTTADLYSISCPTASMCEAVGASATIVGTADGGATWSVQTGNGTISFFGISCPTQTDCAAVGQDGNSPITTNGGASWGSYISFAPNSSSTTLESVSCTAPAHCFAAATNGSAYLESPCMPYASNVQGCWDRSSTGERGALYSISCPASADCFAAGEFGMVVATTDGGTGWAQQSPPRFTGQLAGIKCQSTSSCVTVGAGVETTSDGGQTWQVRTSGVIAGLLAVSCPSSTTCYAVGSGGGVIKTADGGATWSAQTSGTTSWLSAIDCPSTSVCFAVGLSGALIATTNGGSLWSSQTSGATNDLTGISCWSTTSCIAVGAYGWVTITSNGGSTWAAKELMAGSAFYQFGAIDCPSSTACFAVGDYSTILFSSDGGATWTQQMYGSPTGWVTFDAVTCPSTSVCFAATRSGPVYGTTNGGTTWTSQTTPITAGYLYGLSCPSTTMCFGVGINGWIIATTDGSATPWHLIAPSGTSNGLSGVSCPGPTTCFAISGQTVYATFNGGTGWFAKFSARYSYFAAITCRTTSICYAVGVSQGGTGEGPVYATFDGGTTWAPQIISGGTGYDPGYAAISCLGGQTFCMAVSASGNYIVTNDGSTWSAPASTGTVGTSSRLTAVSCADATHCFVTDNAVPGHTFATTNGGSSWAMSFDIAIDPQAGSTGPFSAIDCPTASSCYAVGASGLVATTSDGGTNWRTDSTDSKAYLTSVSCVSASTCFISGNDASVLLTADFGANWEIQSTGSTAAYAGISCASSTACFVVGDGGAISATTNGDSAWVRNTPSGNLQPVLGLSCYGAGNCYAAAAHTVMATHDATTWTSHSLSGDDYVVAISCPRPNTCFAAGWPGAIYTTSDGGTTWTYEHNPLSGADETLTGISCSSTTNCVAVGTDGTVISTANSGVTWTRESSGTIHNLWSVSCPSASSCVAVGDYGLALTRSGGSWAIDNTGVGYYLIGTTCPTTTLCYAVGYNGAALRTTDRGASWTSVTTNAGHDLTAIACAQPAICLAVGYGGTAVITLDGIHWSVNPTPVYYPLFSVAFPGLAQGWIGGPGGTILANTSLVPSCSGATLTSNVAPPQPGGTSVTFTAAASGPACSSPLYEYWIWTAANGWQVRQPYSLNPHFVLDTTGMTPGTYTVDVWVEQSGSLLGTANYETFGLESWVVGGCDYAALTPNPAPTTGMVTFTATAGGAGCGTPQFQWWVYSLAGGWQMKQSYSPLNSWSVNADTLAAGTYSIDVWVKQQGSPLQYETWALSTIPKGACGSNATTTVTPTQGSPQSVGGTVHLNTTNSGCGATPSDRYWIFPGTASGWQVLPSCDMITGTTTACDWNTAGYKPGTQSLVVHVFKTRPTSSGQNPDTWGLLSYSLLGCSSVALGSSPSGPQSLGTTITLTATPAMSCGAPQYQFWDYSGGWHMVQDFSSNATYNWDTTNVAPGTYAWVVYIKQTGDGNTYDSYALLSVTVG